MSSFFKNPGLSATLFLLFCQSNIIEEKTRCCKKSISNNIALNFHFTYFVCCNCKLIKMLNPGSCKIFILFLKANHWDMLSISFNSRPKWDVDFMLLHYVQYVISMVPFGMCVCVCVGGGGGGGGKHELKSLVPNQTNPLLVLLRKTGFSEWQNLYTCLWENKI